jgi:PAS domain S-box-containing protein
MHISAICPPDRRGEQADVLARVARGERVETFETVRQRKDGSLLEVSLAVSQVRAPDGRLLGTSVLLRDITVRRGTESALRQSEARFRTLTSMSPVGIFLANPHGDCIMVNERWRDYAGLTVEQARGRGWLSALHPDDRERTQREWYESAQRGGEFTSEYRFRRPDGTVTWLRAIARPLPADDGGVGGYVGTVTDITSLKEAEELKDQFLSLISHELRTPLATIYGSSRLLRDRFEQIADTDRTELVEDLVAESERLQRIIENLLLMTRLDAGRMELEPVNLLRLVEHSVSAFQSRHPDRRVEFSVKGEIGPVHGNDMYVEMVVENLLTNAHKYSEHDKPIVLELSAVEGAAELRVKDRGIGIADEDMDRLFAPFFRSRRARAKAAGTGVGLAVCKRVMDAMGGTIWARPRREGGSEFGFRLPTMDTGSNDSNLNGDVL